MLFCLIFGLRASVLALIHGWVDTCVCVSIERHASSVSLASKICHFSIVRVSTHNPFPQPIFGLHRLCSRSLPCIVHQTELTCGNRQSSPCACKHVRVRVTRELQACSMHATYRVRTSVRTHIRTHVSVCDVCEVMHAYLVCTHAWPLDPSIQGPQLSSPRMLRQHTVPMAIPQTRVLSAAANAATMHAHLALGYGSYAQHR